MPDFYLKAFGDVFALMLSCLTISNDKSEIWMVMKFCQLKKIPFAVANLKFSMVKNCIFLGFFCDVVYKGEVFGIWNVFLTIEIAIRQVINGIYFFGAEICTIANT